MNYADWLKTVPVEIREDPLWNQEAYRLALFAADLAWHDTTKLFRDGRTVKLAGQLFEAVGSVGVNICVTEHGTRNTEHTIRNPLVSLAGAATLLLVTSSAALDWPQFRGPAGNGCAPQADPPIAWNETNNIAWKVLLTGRGRSSPIILGEHIWLTTAVEQGVVRTNIRSDDMQVAEHVSLRSVCLDRVTGKSLWEA